MIAYWQLTPNGWTCSDVGDDYTFDAADIPGLWHETFWAVNDDNGGPVVATDAMRYYPK